MTQRKPKWDKQVKLIPEHPNKLPAEVRNVEFWIEWIDAETGDKYASMEPERNVREIKPHLISRYRRDMDNGTFVFNGDPISLIPSNGKQSTKPGKQRIANGNHRVHAAAGLKNPDNGYYSLVLKNMALATEVTYDRNKPRSMADILRSRNEPNATILASITRWATAFERYQMRWDLSKSTPSDGEQEIYCEDNIDDLRWAASEASLLRYRHDMTPSPFGFYLYITAVLTGRQLARQFWIDYFVHCDRIPHNHPAQQLGQKLQSFRKANNDKKIDYNTQNCLAFTAWNAWWNGDDAVNGPWGKLEYPLRWSSENMPDLEPRSTRKEVDIIDDFDEET